jgi:hypothetical protein
VFVTIDEEWFYQEDMFKIYDFQEIFCTLKHGDCSIFSYYTYLKRLWQELDNFRLIPKCICEVAKQLIKCVSIKMVNKSFIFWNVLMTNIQLLNSRLLYVNGPLLNICKVYYLLIQHDMIKFYWYG